MAKIDDRLDALQQGFQNPQLTTGTTWIEDAQMESLQVRRKNAGATHHKLFYLSIGEQGSQQPAVFWGYKFTDALVKAEKWKGTYVKNTKGPRKAVAAG
jgi:hypothetical protein